MKVKKFGDKKITIREIGKSDLRNAKKFQDFINSFICEDAKLSMNKEISTKDEAEFLKNTLKAVKDKKRVYLVAECDGEIAGTTSIEQDRWRLNHVGRYGITIKDKYRGIGLGTYMTKEIIKQAQRNFKPKPKIIKLEVYVNNKPAIGLYKKMGFKIVGKIPKQIQWKGKLIAEYIMLKYL